MNIFKKIKSWAIDYKYMIHGALMSVIYKRPPKHYLEYIKEEKIPVVLIPGILGKWSFMKKLGDKISLEGHPVYIIEELGYNIKEIPESSNKLKNIITHIKNTTNSEKVVLVAHSKGGLIGKYYLINNNQDNIVQKMITIATPFSGSSLAKIIPHKSFKELLPESLVIKEMKNNTDVNEKIISIIPEYDNHVWSSSGSYLEKAKNIILEVHGHHKVIFDDKTIDIILQELGNITKQN